MKLPIIKSVSEYIVENNEEDVNKAIAVLEHVSQARGFKPEELDVIGELLSNFYGALEVNKMIVSGKPQREALNEFMQRVIGSIN